MRDRRHLYLGLILAAAAAALYWPATHYGFVWMDDDQYVFDNPWVTGGLSWAGIHWALTTTFAANWHPLTWMSHQLDTSLFGPGSAGPHLTNIVLHAINVLLLFLLLWRWTKSEGLALAVAALFAWHPLQVESVAWISERKNVLSTLWWLAALGAYGESVRGRERLEWRWYGFSIFFFTLGLMSKPMVVTLPFVLLLLDYGAFNRSQDGWGNLVLEKIPFFLLAAAGCVITLIAQHDGAAVRTLHEVSLINRLSHVPLAYFFYLEKTIWPEGLCAFYPLDADPHYLAAIASGLILLFVTVILFVWRETRPWLLVGWLWFLGTLVPVIGLVQVGLQAAADRYMYVPAIGLFLMAGWAVSELIRAQPSLRLLCIAGSFAVVMGAALAMQWQLGTWRDNFGFYFHILETSGESDVAENGLGVAFSNEGDPTNAIVHLRKSIKLNPAFLNAHYNLATELTEVGQSDEALKEFYYVLQTDPRLHTANENGGTFGEKLHNNIGALLAQQGKFREAAAEFDQAIRDNPRYAKPYLNKARVLQSLGDYPRASEAYEHALQLEPDSVETLERLAEQLSTCPDPNYRNSARAAELTHRVAELKKQSP